MRNPALIAVTDVVAGPERARRGERDAAIAVVRNAVTDLFQAGRLGYVVFGAGALVEILLERGTQDDLAEAEKTIDQLASLCTDQALAMVDITLLRSRALLARARDDETEYRDLAQRYRAMAESLNFKGHIAWAEEVLG